MLHFLNIYDIVQLNPFSEIRDLIEKELRLSNINQENNLSNKEEFKDIEFFDETENYFIKEKVEDESDNIEIIPFFFMNEFFDKKYFIKAEAKDEWGWAQTNQEINPSSEEDDESENFYKVGKVDFL